MPAIALHPQARTWLTSLITRLRTRAPGEIYPMDAVERELVLNEIDRLREAHQDIVRKYEKIMGEPPYWTTFTGSELKLVREAWYGAASISRKALADEQKSKTYCPWCKIEHDGACERLISGGQSD